MARYYRRRYRTIVRAPKKKWGSNYVNISQVINYGTDGSFSAYQALCRNSTETTAPTPVIVKTGNFKVQFDLILNVGGSGAIEARAYIFFVPQGFYDDGFPDQISIVRLVSQHPEWIMAWRQLDFGNANVAGSVDTSVVRMSSRLKRNLNSGDQIYFAVVGSGNFTNIETKGSIAGAAQFWTCAN